MVSPTAVAPNAGVFHNGERGHALGLAMVILLLLSAGASLLALDLGARLRADRASARAFELRLLSDAALARALAGLDQLGETSQPELRLGRGSIRSDGRSIGTRRWVLEADAWVGAESRAVEVEVVREGSSLRVVRWRRLEAAAKMAAARQPGE